MYKVFFNNKLIKLTTELSPSTDEVPLFFIKYISAEEIIRALKSKIIKQIILYHSKEEKLMMHFNNKFKTVEASGGLVKNKSNCILFIYRNNKWDLPKGKKEINEQFKTTAVREVQEECGLGKELSIEKFLVSTFHTYSQNSIPILKRTDWYLMNYFGLENLKPQIEEGISKVVWVSFEKSKSLSKLSYSSIRQVWQSSIL